MQEEMVQKQKIQNKNPKLTWLALMLCLLSAPSLANSEVAGRVEETKLVSQHLRDNLLDIDPQRSVTVYLPPGYANSGKAYPVIYHFHSIFWSARQMFEDGQVKRRLDEGIINNSIGEFILVAADFTTPHVGTFFGNSPATGRWLDFIVEELVPFIDSRYRTLPQKESRGLMGDAIGGHAALRLAMLYPEHFNVIYAMHPYGTGQGLIPSTTGPLPNWRKMNLAKSWQNLDGDGRSMVFMAMAQAHLPNPNRPPFFADLMMELDGEDLVMNDQNVRNLMARFSLSALVPDYAANLRKLAGIKFDWGRYDLIQDHVYDNQAFTRTLHQFGVPHEAEEYAGNQWDQNWKAHGRVATEVLPFFNRFLAF